MSVHVVDGSRDLYTPWSVVHSCNECRSMYIATVVSGDTDMEHRLSGLDTSLGGVEQALEAATNLAGKISIFELSISWLYVCP